MRSSNNKLEFHARKVAERIYAGMEGDIRISASIPANISPELKNEIHEGEKQGVIAGILKEIVPYMTIGVQPRQVVHKGYGAAHKALP